MSAVKMAEREGVCQEHSKIEMISVDLMQRVKRIEVVVYILVGITSIIATLLGVDSEVLRTATKVVGAAQ